MIKSSFAIKGMHCDACQRLIAMKLQKIEGVEEVSVSETGEAIITAGRQVDLLEAQSALAGTEYTVSSH